MASSLSALAHSRARCALNGCVQRLRFSQWSNAAGDAAAAMANGTSVLLVPVTVADIANARCAAAPPAALPCTMALLTCIGSLRCRLAARCRHYLSSAHAAARLRAFCFFCATVDGAALRVHHVSSSGWLKRSAAAGVYLSCAWQVDGASPTRARRQPLSECGMCCCRVTRASLSMHVLCSVPRSCATIGHQGRAPRDSTMRVARGATGITVDSTCRV
jgi:hypothetical protein